MRAALMRLLLATRGLLPVTAMWVAKRPGVMVMWWTLTSRVTSVFPRPREAVGVRLWG